MEKVGYSGEQCLGVHICVGADHAANNLLGYSLRRLVGLVWEHRVNFEICTC